MDKNKISEMALNEAVFSIISDNQSDLTPTQIFQAWEEGSEPEGVTICEEYEGFGAEYLAEVCESKQNQFFQFAKEILEEASK